MSFSALEWICVCLAGRAQSGVSSSAGARALGSSNHRLFPLTESRREGEAGAELHAEVRPGRRTASGAEVSRFEF